MTRPVSPYDAAVEMAKSIPPEVVEAFNELIAQNLSGRQSVVKQDEVVELILKKMDCDTRRKVQRADLYKKGWLSIETIYQAAGWRVAYNKHGFGEICEAAFIFDSPVPH